MELKTEQLKRTIDAERFGISHTFERDQLKGIIGQERAVDALQLGLQIDGTGYNTYVAGPLRYREDDLGKILFGTNRKEQTDTLRLVLCI